jgi:hypothetical protein
MRNNRTPCTAQIWVGHILHFLYRFIHLHIKNIFVERAEVDVSKNTTDFLDIDMSQVQYTV